MHLNVVVLCINIKIAVSIYMNPRKFQYQPVRYKASKKKPTGDSISNSVKRTPMNFFIPEGINAKAKIMRVPQVNNTNSLLCRITS